MRCFLGVKIKQPLVPEVKKMKDKIRRTGGNIKLVEDGNLHYTIKFLGDVSEEKIKKIDKIKTEITDIKPFKVQVKGMDAFPTRDYIKVIWLGIGNGYDKFKKLMIRINDKLEGLGFEEEEKELIPHMTIGRVRSGKNKKEIKHVIKNLEDRLLGTMEVGKITLFKSNLTTEGPEYKKLKEYKLDG